MFRPQGYITLVGDAPLIERDSISCGHCNQIVMVKPGTVATVYLSTRLHVDPVTHVASMVTSEQDGAHCKVCDKAICLACYAKRVCAPLLKRIEQMEARGRLRQAVSG